MNILSKLYYRYTKLLKVLRLYLMIAGPGITSWWLTTTPAGSLPTQPPAPSSAFMLSFLPLLPGPEAADQPQPGTQKQWSIHFQAAEA